MGCILVFMLLCMQIISVIVLIVFGIWKLFFVRWK